MNRLSSFVANAPVASSSVGPVTPVATHLPLDQGNAVLATAPGRSDLRRRSSSYVGKSYLGSSRRSFSGARQSMFRIS